MQGVTTPLSVPSLLIQTQQDMVKTSGESLVLQWMAGFVGFLLVLYRPSRAPRRFLLDAFQFSSKL